MKKINFIVFLFSVFVFNSANAETKVVYFKGEIKHTYTLENKKISFTDQNKTTKSKAITTEQADSMRAQLLETIWLSTKYKESAKKKCKAFAEITVDADTATVCRADAKNFNRLGDILISYNKLFQ